MAKVLTTNSIADTAPTASTAAPVSAPPLDWRVVLPTLSSRGVTLREPVAGDALALLTALPEEALCEIVPDPPAATVFGLESLIQRLQAARRAGTMRCWAIVPAEAGMAVGLIGLRSLDPVGTAVEGVAVLADEFRGTPAFQIAARLVLGRFFGGMGGHRAEFRVDVRSGRANGALRKLGATQEGVLRRARRRGDEFYDQLLWAIVATDWVGAAPPRSSDIH